MEAPSLLVICVSSFTSVFLLLAFLAATMRILIWLFPDRAAKVDAAVIAAVTTVASRFYPGTRITKIEEVK